jgi:Domain of unknown function (DUF1906)
MTLYAGMDTGTYPGKAVMDATWAASNIFWTGMYLDSPAPVPGEHPVTKPVNGHNRMGGIGPNPVGGWMQGWTELRPGWGILPIYWGQQDPGNADGPIDLREFIAVANAEDAAVKAATAGIPAGAVIYLDWEAGGAPSQQGTAYCRAWFRRLADLGYRPGVYCHPPASLKLRDECPHLYVWNVNLAPAAGDITIQNNQVVLATPSLIVGGGETPDPDAIARQWKFGIGQPPGGPIPGFPTIDADVAAVQDPAFPERRNQPTEIRGGPVVGAATSVDLLAAYAVRRGKVVRVTWSPGAPTLDIDLDGTQSPAWLNPFTTMSATREPAGGVPVDWLAALGWVDADGDGTWHIRTFRHAPGGPWEERTVPDASVTIEPLPGLVIAHRQGGAPEVFTYDQVTEALAVSRWDAQQHAWGPLAVAAAPNGAAAPFLLRTNGFAALSRAPGLLDLFWVGTDSLVRTSFSTAPGVWSDPFVIGDPLVRVHGMANLAVVSPSPDRIEVLFIGRRDGDPVLRLYSTSWSLATLWGNPPNTHEIGGGQVPLEPMAHIAATSRNPSFVDLFVVSLDGHLHNTFLTTASGVWSALRPVAGQSPKLADVSGACCAGPDDVEVLTTARDGSVWATHWDATLADYRPLERLNLLDLH